MKNKIIKLKSLTQTFFANLIDFKFRNRTFKFIQHKNETLKKKLKKFHKT